jgi:hypothetical protein
MSADIQCNIFYTKQAKIFGPTRKKGVWRKYSTVKLDGFHPLAGVIRLSKSKEACGTYGEQK